MSEMDFLELGERVAAALNEENRTVWAAYNAISARCLEARDEALAQDIAMTAPPSEAAIYARAQIQAGWGGR